MRPDAAGQQAPTQAMNVVSRCAAGADSDAAAIKLQPMARAVPPATIGTLSAGTAMHPTRPPSSGAGMEQGRHGAPRGSSGVAGWGWRYSAGNEVGAERPRPRRPLTQDPSCTAREAARLCGQASVGGCVRARHDDHFVSEGNCHSRQGRDALHSREPAARGKSAPGGLVEQGESRRTVDPGADEGVLPLRDRARGGGRGRTTLRQILPLHRSAVQAFLQRNVISLTSGCQQFRIVSP